MKMEWCLLDLMFTRPSRQKKDNEPLLSLCII